MFRSRNQCELCFGVSFCTLSDQLWYKMPFLLLFFYNSPILWNLYKAVNLPFSLGDRVMQVP